MTLAEIMVRIADRVEKSGNCLLWTGATVNGSRPYLTTNGVRVAVRRLMTEANGTYREGCVTLSRCGNPLCVHPNHAIAITKSQHMRRLGKIGGKDPKRLLTIKIQRHPLQKLEPWQVTEIVQTSVPATELAKRYGVSGSLIWRVRRREGHSRVNNPFAGLGAR
jgi:hypothetical protein